MVVVRLLLLFLIIYTSLLNLTFTKKRYSVSSEKVTGNSKIVFFSDLHLKQYGRRNSHLLNEIEKENPDYIVIGGDLIITYPAAYHGVRNQYKWLYDISQFMSDLCKICPVYYVDGNHEVNLKTALDGSYSEIYKKYIKEIENAGAKIINNKTADLNNNIKIYGFVQPIELYKKRQDLPLEIDYISYCIGSVCSTKYNVLLTHDPKYFDLYSDWGADLVLSGHTHGGMVRLGQKGVVAPSYKLFPKYCYGKYKLQQSKLVLTSGLNMHTFPLRWLNPAEFVIIEITCV